MSGASGGGAEDVQKDTILIKSAIDINSIRPDGTLAAAVPPKAGRLLDSVIERIVNYDVNAPVDCLVTFEEIREICFRGRDLLLTEPVFADIIPPVFVFGDIHGQLGDLQKMMKECGAPPKVKYMFLGDYVDRGAFSVETITLLLAYKLRFSNSIFLLRGNHETRIVNRVYGFYDECQRKYGVSKGIEIWTLFQHVFNCLPLAGRIGKRIFCAHGGISEDLCRIKQFERIVRPTDVVDVGLLCDLLWSDPSSATATFADSSRGISKVFGRQAVIDFCAQLNVDLVCRAHQCVMDGYEFFADRRCVTIFSAPCYCGEVDNLAGILYVSRKMECQVLTFKSDRVAKAGGKIQPGTAPTAKTPLPSTSPVQESASKEAVLSSDGSGSAGSGK